MVLAIGDSMNIECYACTGGISVEDGIKALQDGPQVVMGTPSRVADMIQRHILRIDSITILVLEQAEEMLCRGFDEEIYNIFQLLSQSTQLTVLSATITNDVLELTTKLMRDPIRILVKMDESTLLIFKGIKQFFIASEMENSKLGTNQFVRDYYDHASYYLLQNS